MLRITLSSIVILLLLFPSGIKGIHAFSHHESEHCTEHETTHLHEKHHDCKICDFNFDTTGNLSNYNEAPSTDLTIQYQFGFSSFIFYSVFFNYSLRAPPVIS